MVASTGAGVPRIAYFPDSFHEVNGVAHTSRNFAAFATRRKLPFLCVCAGDRIPQLAREGEFRSLELPRSALAISMERDLDFDPLFARHAALIERTLREFAPDVIHITGPSELGIFGAYFAWKLGVPLAASWHTNVHEYASRRMVWLSRHLGETGRSLDSAIEAGALDAITRFYRLARVLYAPNPQLCDLLRSRTGQPCHLMQRGVDTALFTPARRKRRETRPLLGFVGRLSVEKDVGRLPQIAQALATRNLDVQWRIIGHGAELDFLREAMPPNTEFPGVLTGEALAEAYADMDIFVFPSHTDTFGNVVLEALASGVPAVVTPDGGPASIVCDGETGRIVPAAGFAAAIVDLLTAPARHAQMRDAGRAYALNCSWDAVFERVLAAYPAAPLPE
jgi:glycosyltransferase involved in cell wall biosynthesis